MTKIKHAIMIRKLKGLPFQTAELSQLVDLKQAKKMANDSDSDRPGNVNKNIFLKRMQVS